MPTPEQIEEAAKRGYIALGNSAKWKLLHGQPMLAWEALSAEAKTHWRANALAILTYGASLDAK